MKLDHMPSMTTCVIKNNSVVYKNAFGYSNIYLRKKASVDTIYVAGSISKTVIATAIMQLVEQNKIDLDENISHFFPFDIKNPNYPEVNITLRMLLAHQSSLNQDFSQIFSSFPFMYNATQFIKERIIPSEPKYDETLWCDYKPGEDCKYSNIGYLIVGEIIENVTGKPYDIYCQENIFEPLGMNNTSFDGSKFDKKNIARPYMHLLGPIYIPIPHLDFKCITVFCGLRTNILDMSRFVIMHLNNGTYNDVKILNESTVKLMHTIQYNSTMKMYSFNLQHGLGWLYVDIFGEIFGGYNGGAFGYCCNILTNETSNTAVLTFFNFHFFRGGIHKINDMKLRIYYKIAKLLLEKAA
jgi:CubicO group peptidase (beta-lactamase class C family)